MSGTTKTIRISDEINKRLKAVGEINGHSINKTVVFGLDNLLKIGSTAFLPNGDANDKD